MMNLLWRPSRWVIVLLMTAFAAYWVWFSPLTVETLSPVRQTVIAEVMGTGTLEARVSTLVSSKIAGRIERVLVDQGERVHAGQILVQLDDEELKQQVGIAEANREAAQAAAVRIKADKDRATAVFQQAQRHESRVRSLREKQAAAQEDLDRAAESLAVATADITRAEAAITEGGKSLIAAEKTLEYHRARLADTVISAPFDGLIVVRHREAGSIAVPGSALLTLISTEVLWISAWVDETELSKLKIDQPVRVIFRSQPERSYSGQVARLGKQADRETREMIIDVRLKELPDTWAVGQRAEVFIETARQPDVLTLPTHSLVRRESVEGVFVADNGVARWRPLTLGLRGRESVEILRGLDESDRVIRMATGSLPRIEGRQVRTP